MKFNDGKQLEGKKLWGGEPILCTDSETLCRAVWNLLFNECQMNSGICRNDDEQFPFVLVLVGRPKTKETHLARKVANAYACGVRDHDEWFKEVKHERTA